MQVTVTNICGVGVALNTGAGSPYNLSAGATNVALTMPDSELPNLAALRNNGRITYTVQVAAYAAPDYANGKIGRTTNTSSAYAVTANDFGCFVDLPSGGVATLPANAAPRSTVSFLQSGTTAITFAVATGGTLRMPGSTTKTNGQWTVASAFVRDNVGGQAAEWVVAGNIA